MVYFIYLKLCVEPSINNFTELKSVTLIDLYNNIYIFNQNQYGILNLLCMNCYKELKIANNMVINYLPGLSNCLILSELYIHIWSHIKYLPTNLPCLYTSYYVCEHEHKTKLGKIQNILRLCKQHSHYGSTGCGVFKWGIQN